MTPDDPLLERYREANELDPARPSNNLRENVLARARAVAKAPTSETRPPAANDAFWRWRALGGLAVLGLATLVVLQFDRGTPEERDAVMAPTAPPATRPSPAPPAAPSAAPKPVAPPVSSARPPPPAPPVATEPAAPPAPEARTRSAESVTAAPSPSPAPAPALRAPGAPAPSRAQDSNADAPAESAPPARAQARSEAQGALAREADVNAIDAEGRTALMRAALQGDDAQVHRLLEAGADPARRDKEGRSAADLAREAGHAAVLAILEGASAAPR